MSQPFAFPPPPPPPPKPLSNQGSFQQQSTRGGHGGRGGYPSQQNARSGSSRGRYPSRGSYRGGNHGSRGSSLNRPNTGHTSYTQGGTFQVTGPQSTSYDGHHNGNLALGQKRPHSTAFSGQSHNGPNIARPRPLAPPPVPSFGIDFNALLPKKPESAVATTPPTKSTPTRKTNILGLTPALQTPNANSDSESDAEEEEESKLATSLSANVNALSFEYNGQASSLSTPEEIAAWIAERRKKWPTEAKREVARQQEQEKRKKYEAEKAARVEAGKAAAKERQELREKQRIEKEKSLVRKKMLQEQVRKAAMKAKLRDTDGQTQTPAQIKADKLRRKAEKIAQRLRRAELALDKETGSAVPDQGAEDTYAERVQNNDKLERDPENIEDLLAQVDKIAASKQDPSLHDPGDSIVDTDIDTSDDDIPDNPHFDDTSTSGSSSDSDTDSDSSPEQLSSKAHPQPQLQKPTQSPRPLCTTFTKTGRCKFGRRCHYRHEKPPRDKSGAQGQGQGQTGKGRGRKGLYQVMVEKEVESERRRAVSVIIGLGEGGWFDPVSDEVGDENRERTV